MRKPSSGAVRALGIIQARMGSTRLPGKSMADLCGKPLLQHVIERVRRCVMLDRIVVALPREKDSPLPALAAQCHVGVYVHTGDPNDLLERFVAAARTHAPRLVVRICADNPCLDHHEIDRIVTAARIDYWLHRHDTLVMWSNTHDFAGNGYPDGVGAEVYPFSVLEYLHETESDAAHREHPHKRIFAAGKVHTIPCPEPYQRPKLRLDVNTLEDLEFVRGIYTALYPVNPHFGLKDIVPYVDALEKRPLSA